MTLAIIKAISALIAMRYIMIFGYVLLIKLIDKGVEYNERR